MAIDAPAWRERRPSHADGTATAASWPGMAAPPKGARPARLGMLALPRPQGPAGFRQRVNKGKKERVIGLQKGASTGAHAYLPAQSSNAVGGFDPAAVASMVGIGAQIPPADSNPHDPTMPRLEEGLLQLEESCSLVWMAPQSEVTITMSSGGG
ncbi:hypothetical protein ZWY2020_031603 [Hordeum vulgare]|nr:hypothetical protein ZWY2020_031603 [Hordeum vulgare]